MTGGTNNYQYSTNPMATTDPLGLQATGGGTVGIGIDANTPSAFSGGVLNLSKDTGHTFAYVKDAAGNTQCVYSVGSQTGGVQSPTKFFLLGEPRKTNWSIGETSRASEWSLNADQLKAYAQLCAREKATKVTYSPGSQCTSEAIKLAKECGAPVPDGVSPVKASDDGWSMKYPNPYKLNEQLGATSPGATAPVGTFDPNTTVPVTKK